MHCRNVNWAPPSGQCYYKTLHLNSHFKAICCGQCWVYLLLFSCNCRRFETQQQILYYICGVNVRPPLQLQAISLLLLVIEGAWRPPTAAGKSQMFTVSHIEMFGRRLPSGDTSFVAAFLSFASFPRGPVYSISFSLWKSVCKVLYN